MGSEMNQTRHPCLLNAHGELCASLINNTQLLSNQSERRQVTGSDDLYNWRVGLYGVGGTVVCCCGIVCNIIAIIVLSRFRRKTSWALLLMCLAGLDCLYLLWFLFLETLAFVSAGGLITPGYRAFMTPVYGYLFPVPLICQTCSAYVIVVITLERFIVIAWPIRARNSTSYRYAVVSVCLCVSFGVLYHIPDYLAHRHVEVWSHKAQDYVGRIMRTEFGKGHFYNKVYFTWMNFIVNFLLPFALLLTFNGLTLTTLCQSEIQRTIVSRSQTHAREVHQKRLAVMIISMTAVFFLCELMAAISFIYTAHLVAYGQASIHINRLVALADFLMLFKSAVNFLIYCATGSSFREAFRKLFCRCFQTPVQTRNGHPHHHSSSASGSILGARAGRSQRPLSSVSSSSAAGRSHSITLTSLDSHHVGNPRTSSIASSGAGEGLTAFSKRLGSSSSSLGAGYTNRKQARVSLSTIEASDSCVNQSESCAGQSPHSPPGLWPPMKTRDGAGEILDKPSVDPLALKLTRSSMPDHLGPSMASDANLHGLREDLSKDSVELEALEHKALLSDEADTEFSQGKLMSGTTSVAYNDESLLKNQDSSGQGERSLTDDHIQLDDNVFSNQ